MRAMNTSATTSDPSIRVLQLTDPHLFADRSGSLRDRVSYDTLSTVVGHYLDSGWQADVVYLTGDLVQDDSRAAYQHIRDIIGGIGLPVFVVPGNHDVPELMAAELDGWTHCGTIDAAGWQIIGIDSQEPGMASGLIGAAELARLESLLESGSGPAAVFLHHPPVDLGSEWLDGVGLEDRDELLELVGRHPRVRLLAFGHVHQAYDSGNSSSLRIIGTPSTCRQFKPGSAEFAVDDRPPAYRRFEFMNDGTFATELVWVE